MFPSSSALPGPAHGLLLRATPHIVWLSLTFGIYIWLIHLTPWKTLEARLELEVTACCVKPLNLGHAHDVRGASQLGGGGWLAAEQSGQLIMALFLSHLLCCVDGALPPWEGSFFFFFKLVPLSLSIIFCHEPLTPSSITALPSECTACLLFDRRWVLALGHPVPATSTYKTCPSLWGKEPPGFRGPQWAAWAHEANLAEWQNMLFPGDGMMGSSFRLHSF